MKLIGRFGSSLGIYTFTIFLSLVTLISLAIDFNDYEIVLGQGQDLGTENCITFDDTAIIIIITCEGSTTLTDIYNEIQDSDVLDRELISGNSDNTTENYNWVLNAGIIIEKDSWLYINSTDTSWLKIISNDITESANGIQVSGGLKIDSVKISSWNPEENDYVIFDVLHKPREDDSNSGYDSIPRSYIRVEGDAKGTTDITNSELAYLGYEDEDDNRGRSGLLYYGGNGSLIKNNEIHNLRFGFYSSGVSNITLEDNRVYDNYMYGFDPHTGTHDMIIRNNTVYNNGAMGIICSLDCYNVLIEENTVSNNFGSGIMLSRNMYDSVVRNNVVYDEKQCIFVSASHNNEIYNNKVRNCDNGIYLKSESSNNVIYDNQIQDSRNGILINSGSSDSRVSENLIVNSSESDIKEDTDAGKGNIIT